MRKILISFAAILMLVSSSFAQKVMTPPHVMVVPDLIYCKSHGYTQQFNNNGITEVIPAWKNVCMSILRREPKPLVKPAALSL